MAYFVASPCAGIGKYKLFSKVAPVAIFFVVAIFCFGNAANAVTPILYSNEHYQGPVSGQPDGLLYLPGSDLSNVDMVVYQRLHGSMQQPVQPSIPSLRNTTDSGFASIIAARNGFYDLTIHLPKELIANDVYVLWVRNNLGQWSNGIRINNARPLWISPDFSYTSERLEAFSRRYLKVIGRNMKPVSNGLVTVQLSGPSTYFLVAKNDYDNTTAIEDYVAEITLPDVMSVGSYDVLISKDGINWAKLEGQKFVVKNDPISNKIFPVSSYGGCQADDNTDDTACVISAISAAATAGGGTVTFSQGVWDIADSSVSGVTSDGIVVPLNINLEGDSTSKVVVKRMSSYTAPYPSRVVFTMEGNNIIKNLEFADERVYKSSDNDIGAFLGLGKRYYRTNIADQKVINNVTITNCVFNKVWQAIGSGGLYLKNIFITNNIIGAFHDGIDLTMLSENKLKSQLENAVVSDNIFFPGSYVNASIGQGVIASQLPSSYRVDVSNNSINGEGDNYLYNPIIDQKGWRAGLFWSMQNNTEEMLVSKNTLTCTGDKAGDGEAIAFDGNHNTFAFARAQEIVAATINSVTVTDSLAPIQEGNPVPADYYVDHWVEVLDGKGAGQVRRVVSYSQGLSTRVQIFPDWDVVPDSSSRLSMQREFWQTYVIDNYIDNREPLCQKSNLNFASGSPSAIGQIGVWAQAADMAIEGNRQYDSGGIGLNNTYMAVEAGINSSSAIFSQSNIDIRNNIINGEYNWDSSCSWSGIFVFHGSSPTPSSLPPRLSYGVSISGNRITRADAYSGGAISFPLTWFNGPSPYNGWAITSGALVYLNAIENISGNNSLACGAYSAYPRVGIITGSKSTWNTVLYANTFINVSTRLKDSGQFSLSLIMDGDIAPFAPGLLSVN
ncbi:MAG: hypothetical protein WCG01_03835 [bacterium]